MKKAIIFTLMLIPELVFSQAAEIFIRSGEAVKTKIVASSNDQIMTNAGTFVIDSLIEVRFGIERKVDQSLYAKLSDKGVRVSFLDQDINNHPEYNNKTLVTTESKDKVDAAIYNFHIQEGEVIWKKVFDVEMDSVQMQRSIISMLNRYPHFKDIRAEGNTITASIDKMLPDYKKAGHSYMLTPYIISNGKWFGKLSINMKPGKYRVVISGATFDAGSVGTTGLVTVESDVDGNFSNVVLKKTGTRFKPGQYETMSILNDVFINQFTINKVEVADDW